MVLMHVTKSFSEPAASLAAQAPFAVPGVLGVTVSPGLSPQGHGRTLPCADCSLCRQPERSRVGSKRGKTPRRGAETVLKRGEREHRHRALGHRRHGLTFPWQQDEPSVLFMAVSSVQIVPVLCTGLRAVFFIY